MEDRSNRVYGCPCEWSSESISNGREADIGWKFESGRYEGEDLAGLGLAAVLAGKATLSEAATLRRSTVYADSAAPEPQRRAGVAWLRSHFGDLLGTVLALQTVPIKFQFALTSVSLQVGGILDVRMRQAEFGLDTMPWATLLYEPFIKLASSTLGTSLHTQYAGPELAIGWRAAGDAARSNGIFRNFRHKVQGATLLRVLIAGRTGF